MSQRRRARLVIRTPDARRSRRLQDVLAVAEIDAVALTGSARPAPDGEDLTLIDADGADAAEFAKAVRRDVQGALAIVGATTGQPIRPSPLDGWIALDDRADVLRRVLNDIRRDGVAREEARVRRRTAASLGLSAAPAHSVSNTMSALFVGPPNTAFLAFEHAWRDLGGMIGATFTSFSAFDHLQDERFDAVVLNAADDALAAISLAGAMRRNAGLYHAPILALAAEDADRALERNCDVLVRKDQDLARPAAWLAESVDRAHRRRATLSVLKAVPEPRSPWSASTLKVHLEALAASHHSGGRALSVALVRFRASAEEKAARRRLERADLSARLIRAADCVSMLDEGALAFVFPCTDESGAQAAMQRIRSVWSHAALGAEDKLADHECVVVELAPGESGAALLARARRFDAH